MEREMDLRGKEAASLSSLVKKEYQIPDSYYSVSYTHLRAHETGRNLVCRLLLEKKKKKMTIIHI